MELKLPLLIVSRFVQLLDLRVWSQSNFMSLDDKWIYVYYQAE